MMSPWLFNVYTDGVVRDESVRVLGKELELLVGILAGLSQSIVLYHLQTIAGLQMIQH